MKISNGVKKIFLIVFFSLLVSFFSVSLVMAGGTGCPTEGLVPCGNVKTCPCEFCDFFVMLDRIIDFVLIILVPALAALMIAIGGFMMISAYAGGGGPEMFSRAKTLFTAIVIGLVIIYGAWLVINLFLMVIGVAEWTNLKEGWWQIKCQ